MKIQLILSTLLCSIAAKEHRNYHEGTVSEKYEGKSSEGSNSNSFSEETFFIPDEQLEQQRVPPSAPIYQKEIPPEPIEVQIAPDRDAPYQAYENPPPMVEAQPLPEPEILDEDGLTKEQAAERQQFLADVGQAYLQALMEYEYQELDNLEQEEKEKEKGQSAPVYQQNQIFYVQNNQQNNVLYDVKVAAPQENKVLVANVPPPVDDKAPPRLAVDPPRQRPIGMQKDYEAVEMPSDMPKADGVHSEPSVMTPPSFMAVVVDLTDVLIVLIAAVVLLWVLNKAYRYFMYPREVAKTQKVMANIAALDNSEAGSVHKVPLP
ncbi:hypothetical protein WR25_15835 [Diploscapter pachys]|uniref:Uncharacterized protein n=1 Tax=Diploscapter pachys TaxID=2018661 RepID=A0A2A2JQW8_9BILA|nr:hypothetical protein WR25_15835 [Diploscapter pachys]